MWSLSPLAPIPRSSEKYGSVDGGVKAVAHPIDPSTREDVAMSGFGPELRELLSPAVEAARAALADLDADEIPASLRRVAAYSGGHLPPPLAKSVLIALDADDWLRSKSIEKLADRHSGSAAEAFLERGEQWWTVVADGLAEAHAGRADAASAESAAAVDELSAQLAVAKRRLKKAGAELDAERVRARRRASTDREARKKPASNKAAARTRELEARLSSAVDERVEAEAMIARLRARLKGVLREQRRASSERARSRELGGSPITTARQLDLMAAAAPHRSGTPAAGEDEEPIERSALRLPPGVRPDAPEAIAWLIGLEAPVTVIVDGYNVLYGLDASTFTTSRSRRRLSEQLGRLRRNMGTSRVAVVYDSSLPGDREPRLTEEGVEVHFSAEERLADDRIVELAADAERGVVVITSDRDLRERAEAVGALALWSESLTGWISGPV